MTNVDNPNSLPLATDLSTGAISANNLVTPNISLLAMISTCQVSLNQPGTSTPGPSPSQYAGA